MTRRQREKARRTRLRCLAKLAAQAPSVAKWGPEQARIAEHGWRAARNAALAETGQLPPGRLPT